VQAVHRFALELPQLLRPKGDIKRQTFSGLSFPIPPVQASREASGSTPALDPEMRSKVQAVYRGWGSC